VRGDELLAECRALIAAVRDVPSFAALRRRGDRADLERRIAAVLGVVRRHEPPRPPAPPADPERVRAIHWNIEHGNRYSEIERALVAHPQLEHADLVFLNEVDLGMARSGNRDVAGDLAAALGLHGVWVPQFLETTPGRDDDVAHASGGENRESLFGIALLARWPVGDVRVVELPGPEWLHFDRERMIGRQVALTAAIERPDAPFLAVNLHLSVHVSRIERAAQMRSVLDALRREERPVALAGDFNSHTFDRGRWWSPLAGAATLLQPTGPLRQRLLWPDQGPHREPLFDALREANFAWQRFVDRGPTLALRFSRLNELRSVFGRAVTLSGPLLGWMERRAQLKLDWFAGRGWRDGRGATVRGLDGIGRASDHAPIVASFW
jgi:endonuclease/exonuclease/phosphatase family metal-dependent hydrolase